HYLLPFGARGRFLFKMDFAEAEYIARVRSGVKGHLSYRQVAWEMKLKMEQLEPELGRLIEATPPWVEDTLKRRVGQTSRSVRMGLGPRIVMKKPWGRPSGVPSGPGHIERRTNLPRLRFAGCHQWSSLSVGRDSRAP